MNHVTCLSTECASTSKIPLIKTSRGIIHSNYTAIKISCKRVFCLFLFYSIYFTQTRRIFVGRDFHFIYFFDTPSSCGTVKASGFRTTQFRGALAAERSRGFDFNPVSWLARNVSVLCSLVNCFVFLLKWQTFCRQTQTQSNRLKWIWTDFASACGSISTR